MPGKITYMGRDNTDKIFIVNLEVNEALNLGKSFEKDGGTMQICESDELRYNMHKYCSRLDIRMNGWHEFTIKELYEKCPEILLDLLDLNGGSDYIAQILIGYEELYNQQQILKHDWKNQGY